MNASAVRQFAVEVHPPGWRFPAENSWIAGWIEPAPGRMITDVRARLHHRIVLGLSGLPHPAFPAHPSGLGFSLLFTPQPGDTLLRLEARDESGHWREFFRTEISAATNAPAHVPSLKFSATLAPLSTALLRQKLRTPQRTWDDLADELVAAFVAEPLDSHPNTPFVGALEEPHAVGRLRYGKIPINGWLAHPSAKILRLSAVIDPLPAIALPYGLERQDVAGAFPALSGHPHSAFAGEIALPLGLATPVLLKIFATLEDGGSHLIFARRFIPVLYGDTGQPPLLTSGRALLRALWALSRAAARHGLPRTGVFGAARKTWSARPRISAYRPESFWSSDHASLHSSTGLSLPSEPALTVIDPADDMHVANPVQYFREGRDALAIVQAAVAQTGGGQVTSILDLPCGFGRVGRWLRTAYPEATLSVSDTQKAGVDFCIRELSARGLQAQLDGSHWADLPGPYDIIWCGSLLTHFGREQWITHLRRFGERLSPTGVLIFTSHGLLALDIVHTGEKNYGLPPPAPAQLCSDAVATGFGYVDYADTPGYGISIAQPGWIRELIAQETALELVAIHPAAWGQHQDVIICRRR
jgi:Methyltransferase domain